MFKSQNKNEVMGCLSFSSLVLTCLLSLAGKAVMAPNLDSFGRDRAAYQENSRQRRIAEREARRYEAQSYSKDTFPGFVGWIVPVGYAFMLASGHEMPSELSFLCF